MYIKEKTKAAGVMLARPALYDCSVFDLSSKSSADCDAVMRAYLSLACLYDNHFVNTKYVVCEFMNMRRHPPAIGLKKNEYGKGQTVGDVCSTKSMEELCGLFDVEFKKGGGESGEGGGLASKYSDDYFLKEEEKKEAESGEGDERPAKKAKQQEA